MKYSLFRIEAMLEKLIGDKAYERGLWSSQKYERVYLHAFETGSEARNGIERLIRRYNEERPYASLDDRTPHEAYWNLPAAYQPVVLAA